ncbi:MAG: hypothetical protein EBW08_01645 [Pelagibacteraceae bacterium]|nr:hypothetical protein [Pelagibacteraceae bacterium]
MRFSPFGFMGNRYKPGNIELMFDITKYTESSTQVYDINIFSNGDIGIAGDQVTKPGTVSGGMAIYDTNGNWLTGVYQDFGRRAPNNEEVRSVDRLNDGKYAISSQATQWSGILAPNITTTRLVKLTSGCTYESDIYNPDFRPQTVRNTTNFGILAVGNFTGNYYSSSGSTFTGLNGTIPTNFNIQSDGKIVFCTNVGLKRYNTNASLDTGFTCSFTGTTDDVVFQSDGKIVCVGNGVPNRITRLNTDGSTDTTYSGVTSGFTTGATYAAQPMSCTIDSQNRVIVGTNTSMKYNGVSINGIVRLDTTGNIDPTINFVLIFLLFE